MANRCAFRIGNDAWYGSRLGSANGEVRRPLSVESWPFPGSAGLSYSRPIHLAGLQQSEAHWMFDVDCIAALSGESFPFAVRPSCRTSAKPMLVVRCFFYLDTSP